jgi:hypothetical protein
MKAHKHTTVTGCSSRSCMRKSAITLHPLHLETLRSSPSSGPLKLPSLTLNIWLLALMRAHAKVLHRLSRILGSTQQNHIASSWVLHSQLIDSHALTTCSLDSCASSCGESESGNVEFGDFEKAVVVGDGADDADGLVFVGFLSGLGGDFAGDAGDRHGGTIDARHEEAAEDDFVEVGIGAA